MMVFLPSVGPPWNPSCTGFIDSLPEKEDRRVRIPMGRYGSTAEIAKTAAFLLSDDAGYITGQNVLIDGGAYPGTF
mgnify:CR=1 FL=1